MASKPPGRQREGSRRGSRPRPDRTPLKTCVAVVSGRGKFMVADPLFEPGGRVSLGKAPRSVRSGQMAVIETDGTRAKILRPLGFPERARDVVDALIWDAGMFRGFTGRVGKAADEAVASATQGGPARRDLTELATFTVDPASAHDFDDAVSAQPAGDGIRLWVHIADVSAYVKPASTLDDEALRRGNSVYLPGTVEPMLPHALSSDACSLAPGVERLAVTTEMLLGADAKVKQATFYRSIIRSDARLDYDALDRIFAGTEAPPEDVAEPITLARKAAATLAESRILTTLAIESSEPEFEFDDEGHVIGARSVPQTEAHSLIEQLMVLTNEQVAEFSEKRGLATIYRVHERPDPERLGLLFDQLASLDVPTPALPDVVSPAQAGKLIAETSRYVLDEIGRRGHGDAYTVLILRSLQQARYSPENLGHAGLGSSAYCHFTSPIRRYSDLVAHRALLAELGEGEAAPSGAMVAETAIHLSETEREAMRLERRGDKVCSSFLLELELKAGGALQRFEGEVSGLNSAGAFVRFEGEMADIYEGFLPARVIGGRERYELNELETALVGLRGGDAIRLGDAVDVQVSKIDKPRGRIDLDPFGES